MGRSRYSEEERAKITVAFLRCTREIIDLEGIDGVSIRRVAQCAGFNSATLYLYFKDIDELITLACMSYLENYCRTLSADIPHLNSPYELYLHTWRVFGQHAFAHPQIFHHLFFREHSLPMSQTVARYYELCPSQLPDAEGVIRDMLLEGDLKDRNLRLLKPLGEEMHCSPEQITMINDLTICYFKMLLEQQTGEAGVLSIDRKQEQMLHMVAFLLRRDR